MQSITIQNVGKAWTWDNSDLKTGALKINKDQNHSVQYAMLYPMWISLSSTRDGHRQILQTTWAALAYAKRTSPLWQQIPGLKLMQTFNG